jgi:hypothetical protein
MSCIFAAFFGVVTVVGAGDAPAAFVAVLHGDEWIG